jgi:hypothetical protein
MIYVLEFLVIVPLILAMLWNGLHGRGYKVTYQAPPLNTNKGKAMRVVLFIAGIGLLSLVAIARYDQSTSEGYTVTGRFVSVIVSFGLIVALSIYMRSRRNR